MANRGLLFVAAALAGALLANAADATQGSAVHLTGTIATIVDFCQQGPILTNIKWKSTPFRCPPPQAK
jgi:hypothetical protein